VDVDADADADDLWKRCDGARASARGERHRERRHLGHRAVRLAQVARRPLQRVELNQGTLQPVNFFASADGSQIYIASANSASILVYDFTTGALTGIELVGNATPLSADISPDAGTIVIAGSDGLLHQVSTALGGNDVVQLTFPDLPNYLNPFCTFTPTQGPCTLNTVLVKP